MTKPLLLLAVLSQPAWSEACRDVDAVEAYRSTDTAPPNATCAIYTSEANAAGTSCHWGFPFRDAAARAFADALWEALDRCRAGQRGQPDQKVNHPDSYDLKALNSTAGTYLVTLKDKGALGKTLVFLRFEQTTQN